MIFPFNLGGGKFGPDDWIGISENQQCISCGKLISQHEKCIQFHWGNDTEEVSIHLHVDCAENVALMMMRDVAECRCGREAAQARYRRVREIVPYPE
jgi:hypothetical protein